MDFTVKETCPKCHGLITVAEIEAHPSRDDLAIHNYLCEKCGPIMAKLISLKPKNREGK
jgi:ssDNA-binding Zn-finger/Zn-ribbon topoisomerase 1